VDEDEGDGEADEAQSKPNKIRLRLKGKREENRRDNLAFWVVSGERRRAGGCGGQWAGVGGKASMCLCHKRFLITILLLFPLLFFFFCFVSFFFYFGQGSSHRCTKLLFSFSPKSASGQRAGRGGEGDVRGRGDWPRE